MGRGRAAGWLSVNLGSKALLRWREVLLRAMESHVLVGCFVMFART